MAGDHIRMDERIRRHEEETHKAPDWASNLLWILVLAALAAMYWSGEFF